MNHLIDLILFSRNLFLHQSDLIFVGSKNVTQGRSKDFSKGGVTAGTPSGDRRLYMVYTAALPRVSAGSVVLSRHEGPY